MKKYTLIVRGVCCLMVFFFVSSALAPICNAQTSVTQVSREETFQELPVKNIKHSLDDNESFFNFAIIWGTFEHNSLSSLFGKVFVENPEPWYNRTMNVIGYQNWDGGKWFVKKSYEVECNVVHIGVVGKNWLFIIAYGNIAAW